MADQKALSIKEISFIDRYFEVGFNATEAYLSVNPGCERSTARAAGARMLQRTAIRDEIERRMKAFRAARRMTVEDIGDLLQDMATVDVLDLFNDEGDLKPLSEMTPAARRCIASIETEERWLSDKDEPFVVKKIKLVDRKGAAELLGKYKKMFSENLDITSGGKPLKVAVSITGKGRG